MSWTNRFNNPGYKNWLRVGIALLFTRDGLTNVTLQVAKDLHAELKVKLGDSVEKCTCNPKKGQDCKDCVPWRQELETYYTGDVMRIGWTNCTPSKWSKEPWEVAKVFMPKDPTADNTGPEKSDASALLNFLVHCTYCKRYVSVKSSQKVIEVRNQTMHSKDLTFDPQTFNNHMDKLLRLMDDPNLTSDPAAQKAADEILKIKKGEFHIGANKACLDAEIRVFREFMAEQEKLLQLHKEQLEDHGTRLDSLEGSIPPVEEILKTLGPILDIVNNNPDLHHFLQDQAMGLSTIAQQLQDRLGNVECAVSQLEETVAEHGVQIDVNTRLHEEISDKISDVQQKLGQLKPPSSSTSFSSGTDEQTSAFTSALTINYSNTLKTLKPLPWDDRFCLDLDKIFTRLLLIGTKGHEDRAMFYKSLDDVFDHQPESPGLSKRFNVLVVGDAGSGKSTLFSKTALDWSCKKGRLADRKKIVLLIRLREVEPGESIAEIVWDQCVTKSAKGISISSIETCLQDNESDLVFLLDGYDELVPGAKGLKQAVPELLAKKWYPNCMIIVTSRPSSGIERYMAVDCRVMVLGFSSPLVDKYVPLYFKSVGKPDLVDSLVKVLDSKANIVARGLIQTPMFLMLICVLWEENPTIVQFPVTMTGLYQELLTCVIRKYCVREGLPIPSDEKEIPSEVSAGLCHLGKLALESLLRGESHVVLGKTAASQNTDVLLKLGLVSKEVSASKLHPRQQLNFPHKSMQEFLAARYVADRVNTSSGDLHALVPLDTLSAVLLRRNLVQLISGCGGKVTSKLLEHLNNLYVTEGASLLVNIRKWDDEEQDYVEYFGKGKRLQILCMMSFYEGHDAQHFPILSNVFSSLDLYINVPSREGIALKYYLDHARAAPEGRSLTLKVVENSDGDAVEYLSCLVEKPIPDLQLYLTVGNADKNEEDNFGYIGDMLGRLIPFLTNVPNIRSLNLERTCLIPRSLQALVQILPKLSMLEELKLARNPDIGDIDDLTKYIESNIDNVTARLSSISQLDVLDQYMRKVNEEKRPFAALQQPVASLKVLDLSYNYIGDVCLGSLAAVLHHLSCLDYLDLSNNNIGNEGLEPFAAIQQPIASLKVLDLSCNKIGDVCLGSLIAVLHHLSCLKTLALSYNNIRDVGFASLAATLHHAPTLEYVHLGGNPITAVGLQRFAETIPTMPALKKLSLTPRKTAHLDDTAALSICTMLTRLPVLEHLDLNNISMQAARLQDVSKAAEEHPTLQDLEYTASCVPIGVRSLSSRLKICSYIFL